MSEDQVITRLLAQARGGDAQALEKMIPLVYEELRAIARRHRRHIPSGETMNTTVVVHEAYLKIFGSKGASLKDRAHFFGVACLAMRQVLVDAARKTLTARRGEGAPHTELDGDRHAAAVPENHSPESLLALDEALTRLRSCEPRLAEIVDMRYFGGLTVEEVAELLSVSSRTVQRDWLKAKIFLAAQLD